MAGGQHRRSKYVQSLTIISYYNYSFPNGLALRHALML